MIIYEQKSRPIKQYFICRFYDGIFGCVLCLLGSVNFQLIFIFVSPKQLYLSLNDVFVLAIASVLSQ